MGLPTVGQDAKEHPRFVLSKRTLSNLLVKIHRSDNDFK